MQFGSVLSNVERRFREADDLNETCCAIQIYHIIDLVFENGWYSYSFRA